MSGLGEGEGGAHQSGGGAAGAPVQPPARRRRRWVRVLIWLGGAGLLLGGAGAWMVTRGPVPGWIAVAAVRSALGAELDADSVRLRLDGVVEVRGLRLTAPPASGLAGEEARLLEAPYAEVELDWSGLWSGNVRPAAVRLDAPRLRVSQHRVTAELSVAALRPTPGGSPGSAPEFELRGAVLELGEHGGGEAYRPLVELVADAFLRRSAGGGAGRYSIRLAERASPATIGPPVLLAGEVDLLRGAGELSVQAIDLARWPAERLPTQFREPWRALDIAGRVESVSVAFGPPLSGQQPRAAAPTSGAGGASTVAGTPAAAGGITGVRAQLRVAGVGVNLPIPAGQTSVVGGRTARMEGVTGTIRLAPSGIDANLDGVFTGVSCNLDLVMTGLAADAPYRAQLLARPFRLSESPRLLWFLQPVVRSTVEETFGSPDAVIEAAIYVRRGEPVRGEGGATSPAPPEISGELAFRDGVARSAVLPVGVAELSGQLRFDSRAVTLLGVRGRLDGGGAVFIEGALTPPDETGRLELKTTLTDVPINEALLDAVAASPLAASSGGVGGAADQLDVIFSRGSLALLRQRGLVQSARERELALASLSALESLPPERRGPDHAAELAAARAAADRHVFELGGRINRAEIVARREPGGGSGVQSPLKGSIDLRLDKLGVLCRDFPYPLTGTEVRVVGDERGATVTALDLRGPSGARVELRAFFPLERTEAPRTPAEGGADVRVAVRGARIDEFGLLAIREATADAGPPAPLSGEPELADQPADALLRVIGVEGVIEADARVFEIPGRRRTHEVVVRATPEAPLSASIGRDSGRGVALEQITGRIVITAGRVEVQSLRGTVAPEAPLVPVAPSPWSLTATVQQARPERGLPTVADVAIDAPGASLALPIEPLISRFAPVLAADMADLRSRLDPRGWADLALRVTSYSRPAPERSVVTLDATNICGLELSVLGGRLAAGDPEGSVGLAVDTLRSGTGDQGPADLRFDALRSTPTFDDHRVGSVRLDGPVRIGAGTMAVLEPLSAELRGAELHAPFLRTLVGSYGDSPVAGWMADLDVRGGFDAEARLLPPVQGRRADRRWSLAGEVRPAWLAFRRSGDEVRAGIVSGQVAFTDTSGRLESVSLITDSFDVLLGGGWSIGEGPRAEDSLTITALMSGGRIDAGVRALLPGGVLEAIDDTGLQLNGGFEVRDTAVAVRWLPPPEPLSTQGGAVDAGAQPAGRPVAVEAKTTLVFNDLQADIGVPVRDARGSFDLRVNRAPGADETLVEVDASARTLRIFGVTLGDAVVRLSSRGEGLSVPTITGVCSSGRLSASAQTFQGPGPDGRGRERWYRARVQMAGVRFADLLKELGRAAGPARAALGPRPDAQAPDSAAEPEAPAQRLAVERIEPLALVGGTGDLTRGALDAEFSIEGPVGDPLRRVGRGAVRISGGDVLRIPLAVPVINLINFQLPVDERLDYFHAVMYLRGNTVRFEELGLLSRSLSIMGWGTVALPEFTADLRFASRGLSRLPLLTALWEALRNEIAVVKVTGPLDGPSVGAESLGGTRAMLSGVTGGDPGPDGGVGFGFNEQAEGRARAARARAIAGEALSLPPPGPGAPSGPGGGGGGGGVGVAGGVP